MSHSKNDIIYTPGVISFIPLLYVAWADGLLSPSEVDLIHAEVKALKTLSSKEKEIISNWADPSSWPDSKTFREWKRLIKEAIPEGLDMDSFQTIADLGIRMAVRADKIGKEEEWMVSETRKALLFLAGEIGVPGLRKFKEWEDDRPKSTRELLNGFPLSDLQRTVDGPQHDLIGRVKNLLSDPVFRITPIRKKEEYREQVLAWVKLLADQGLGVLGYPEKYGGLGDMMAYAAVFETLALQDLSLAVKFGVQFGLFGGSIFHLGTTAHHDKYLGAIGKFDLAGCFAMTETGHGSNVRGLETTATYDRVNDDIIIHTPHDEAAKEYIGNALHAKMATVFAQLIVDDEGKGIHAILVPLRDDLGNLIKGVSVQDNGYKVGLNGVDNGKIRFDGVRVPRENLLNRYGGIDPDTGYRSSISNPDKRFFTMLGTLVAGRICVGKGALSAVKSALTIASIYGLKRRQFGPENRCETLLLDYPSHQRRLMPALAEAYALHFALQDLIKWYQNRSEGQIRKIESLTAGLKAYSTDFAIRTIQECREACGGKGYLWENRFADLKADADIFTTFEGDNTVLLQLTAKSLISNFKDEFHHAGVWGAIRYLAEQVSDSLLIRYNPVHGTKTDTHHLLDPDFHSHAFQYRERRILLSLANRMRSMFRKRISPYDAFIRTQNHMLELSKSFVERKVLDSFQKVVDQESDPVVKEHLQKLCNLFALYTIERNKGWYLEHDYLSGSKTKAIRRLVDRLCYEVRIVALPVVMGFGIPKGLVGAPIAELPSN